MQYTGHVYHVTTIPHFYWRKFCWRNTRLFRLYVIILSIWYNFDTVLYQFLETGTSVRCLIYIVQCPRFSGFILYPLSFFLYSHFKTNTVIVFELVLETNQATCFIFIENLMYIIFCIFYFHFLFPFLSAMSKMYLLDPMLQIPEEKNIF